MWRATSPVGGWWHDTIMALSLVCNKPLLNFWNNTRITVSQKRNVMKFRTGTLYTQKMAHLHGRATSSSCLLCHQPDSQIHMLSGCQHASIQNMVTERHNIASRLIIKTLHKGDFGGNIIFTDIGSETRMAQQSLTSTCSQQDLTPMASTKPVSRRTSILLKT